LKAVPVGVYVSITVLICATLILGLALTSFWVSPNGAEQKSIQVLVDQNYYHSLLNDLQNAESSIYVAMYVMKYDADDSFDWANDLIRELVNAKNRGVNVSVIIEYRVYSYYGAKYMDENLPAYNYLLSNGVNVKLENETETDHLKLVIIDDEIVYVGSHNWSESALYYNHETSVKIVSEEIAQTFLEYLKNNYDVG